MADYPTINKSFGAPEDAYNWLMGNMYGFLNCEAFTHSNAVAMGNALGDNPNAPQLVDFQNAMLDICSAMLANPNDEGLQSGLTHMVDIFSAAGMSISIENFSVNVTADGVIIDGDWAINGQGGKFLLRSDDTLQFVNITYGSSITIQYDAAGGTPTPATQTISQDVGVDVSAEVTPVTVTKSTYTFAGWYNGDTLVSSDGQTFHDLPVIASEPQTITLTAHWTRVEAKGGYVIL